MTILHTNIEFKVHNFNATTSLSPKQSRLTARWEEDRKSDGTKWKFLEHRGPMFAPEYKRLPKDARGWFQYNGDLMHLTDGTQEVAGFYAKMLDHDFTTRDVFNNNFFKVILCKLMANASETVTLSSLITHFWSNEIGVTFSTLAQKLYEI